VCYVPARMGAIVVERSMELAAPRSAVWPLVIDTDRVNRLLGLDPVRYEAVEPGHASAARLVGHTRLGGFRATYEELPFEWTFEKAFRVQRNFRGGPLLWLRVSWSLEDGAAARGGHEGGTRLTLRLEAEPRLAVLRPVTWLNLRRSAAGLVGIAAAIDAHLAHGAASPFSGPVGPSDDRALERGGRELRNRGVPDPLAARLIDFLRTAPDADCARIRPFELADTWGLDRREVLVAMLHAVPAGLLDLHWAVVCPSCQTASQTASALEQIGLEGHCQMCDIAFELDLDRAVEATFMPNPAVRRVPDQMFCVAGPGRTPHVLMQSNVASGAEVEMLAPPSPGRYRMFARGGARASVEVSADADDRARVRFDAAHVEPVDISIRPGGTIVVHNDDAVARHVKLERLEYASASATAHYLSTVPEFRATFSRDLLKRGTPLKVARVAILFTDLTGSTALYSQLGDAAAFRFVDDHFDVLRRAVADHRGAVVKTMGDAVMASFVDDVDCVRAAVECLARFDDFRRSHPHGERVGLKLGLYAGASYVVTANGILDYFGQTVNVASRLQHLADAGELVLPVATLAALPGDVRAALSTSAPCEVRVKGVDEAIPIVRARRAG
jgi:adenylate cyclase